MNSSMPYSVAWYRVVAWPHSQGGSARGLVLNVISWLIHREYTHGRRNLENLEGVYCLSAWLVESKSMRKGVNGKVVRTSRAGLVGHVVGMARIHEQAMV